MEFLNNSLLELITQTSTNLPPDVRAAMGETLAAEMPGTQSFQALSIIAGNIDIDQVQPCAAIGAQPDDVAGVGRNLGLVQQDVQHAAQLTCRARDSGARRVRHDRGG
jgi:fumarate hydratase class I